MLGVDETPVRAEGGLTYVHAACTEFLTAMHTGGRSKDDIDAGDVMPGYTGTIVRDGYAHHAWCGAHYADLRIMPMSGRLVLVGGGTRVGEVGIIAAA